MGKSAGTEIEAAKPNCVDNAATAIVNRIWSLIPFSTANADLFHGICQEEIAAAIREDRAEPVSDQEWQAVAGILREWSQEGVEYTNGWQPPKLTVFESSAKRLLETARQARANADEKGGAR